MTMLQRILRHCWRSINAGGYSMCLIIVQTLDDQEGVVLSPLRQKILTLEAEPPRRVERMS